MHAPGEGRHHPGQAGWWQDADHRRGSRHVSTWGELGLTGDWADKPITAYVHDIDQDTSQFFQQAAMEGSQKWTGRLQEFTDVRRTNGSLLTAGQQITAALAMDRYGIAIAEMPYRTKSVKPLALAAEVGGPYIAATVETVGQRRYPLTRTVSIYVNRQPGQPLDAKLREYLLFILSAQGQAAIARDGSFLPLAAEIAERERRRLQ